MQRRTLLRLGWVSAAALLVTGGTVATMLRPGLQDGLLTAAGHGVFFAVGQAVLDQTLPTYDAARKAALEGLLSRIGALTSSLPPHVQVELSQLLSLLDSAAGRLALAGLASPWATASVPEVQKALEGMRLSSLAVCQQAYAALHDITAGAYFSDPSSWSVLAYPGPLKI